MKFALKKVILDDDSTPQNPNPYLLPELIQYNSCPEEVKHSTLDYTSFNIPARKFNPLVSDLLIPNTPHQLAYDYTHSNISKSKNSSSNHTINLKKKSKSRLSSNPNSVIQFDALEMLEGEVNPVMKSRLNTNVVEVPMEELIETTPLATGDPKFCTHCGVLFSCVSILIDRTWICEFCEQFNQVDLEPEEIPTESKLTYIMESGSELREGADSDITIIFCIDISGSMGTTSEVKNISRVIQEQDMVNTCEELGLLTNKSLRTTDQKIQYIYKHYRDNFPDYFNQSSYLTRLDCVISAIEARLTDMEHTAPNRKVGIVTFTNEVNIIGDGTNTGTVQEDRLGNWEYCTQYVKHKHDTFFPSSIANTRRSLTEELKSLKPIGATALGPALLMSVRLASQGKPGSKVIICTDGIANVGLGSLETEEDREAAESFYNDVALIARDNAVCVSIISIQGQECSLEYLEPVVDKSGGVINKVDPHNLSKDFATVLAQEVLATHVRIVVHLHKSLEFRNENSKYLNESNTKLEKELGNVTRENVFAFEYVGKMQCVECRKIPFQVLIYYTKLNGMKCVLADTQEVEIINRDQIDAKTVNFEVLAKNMMLKASHYMKEGRYQYAKDYAIDCAKDMDKHTHNLVQRSILQKLKDDIIPFIQACDEQVFQDSLKPNASTQSLNSKKRKPKRDLVTVITNKLGKYS